MPASEWAGQQDDALAGERERERQQDAEHPAGSTHGRITAVRHCGDDELRHGRGQHGREVVHEVAPRTPYLFQRPAEHPEREHVEEQMLRADLVECRKAYVITCHGLNRVVASGHSSSRVRASLG